MLARALHGRLLNEPPRRAAFPCCSHLGGPGLSFWHEFAPKKTFLHRSFELFGMFSIEVGLINVGHETLPTVNERISASNLLENVCLRAVGVSGDAHGQICADPAQSSATPSVRCDRRSAGTTTQDPCQNVALAHAQAGACLSAACGATQFTVLQGRTTWGRAWRRQISKGEAPSRACQWPRHARPGRTRQSFCHQF